MQNYIPYYQPQACGQPMAYQQPNYIDRYAQQYQPMPQPQPQPAAVKGVTGRYVSTAEEIAANEVAMDGTMSLFPKADLSEIYAKAWKSDGTIQTVIYRPEEQTTKEPERPDVMGIMTERFDEISDRLAKLERIMAPRVPAKKREAAADE